jgi:uncharacterized protein (TIGR02246 family)
MGCIALWVMALFIVTPRPVWAQTSAATTGNKELPSTSQVEKEIASIEQQEAQALLRADTAALERLWAHDLLVTTSRNRVHTGAEVLGFIKSGQMKLSKLDRRVDRVAVHGQVAIAMGEETIVPAGGNNAGKTLNRRYTDVYVQKDGQWRLIARQATLIPAGVGSSDVQP